MIAKETLKQWFKNGNKPPQEQFWAWMDSYFHKDEKIPVEIIEGINEILVNKADKAFVEGKLQELQNLINNLNLNNIDDSLETSSDKTYSIDKITTLFNEIKSMIPDYNIIDDEAEEGNDVTYSVNKIKKLVNSGTSDNGNNTLQEITDKGNSTTKDIILNEAELGRNPENGSIKFGKSTTTNGFRNVAIGDGSLEHNEESSDNVAIGYMAANKHKGVNCITAIGSYAGANLNNSANAIAIGYKSMSNCPGGLFDLAIGTFSLNDYYFSGEEYQSLTAPNITRRSGMNTAIGTNAMRKTLRGFGNTAVGGNAGYYFHGFGDYNTFIGYRAAGIKDIWGDRNVIIGANVPCRTGMYGKLIIHSQMGPKEPGYNFDLTPLIYGDFNDDSRLLQVGGKLRLLPQYFPEDSSENEILVVNKTGDVTKRSAQNFIQRTTGQEFPSTPQIGDIHIKLDEENNPKMVYEWNSLEWTKKYALTYNFIAEFSPDSIESYNTRFLFSKHTNGEILNFKVENNTIYAYIESGNLYQIHGYITKYIKLSNVHNIGDLHLYENHISGQEEITLDYLKGSSIGFNLNDPIEKLKHINIINNSIDLFYYYNHSDNHTTENLNLVNNSISGHIMLSGNMPKNIKIEQEFASFIKMEGNIDIAVDPFEQFICNLSVDNFDISNINLTNSHIIFPKANTFDANISLSNILIDKNNFDKIIEQLISDEIFKGLLYLQNINQNLTIEQRTALETKGVTVQVDNL